MNKINVKPFNEFWLNCSFNAHLSILTSINPEYADLAYLNCYVYIDQKQYPKGIAIENNIEIQNNIFLSATSQEALCFKEQTDKKMLSQIINLLNEYNLFIGVDLFHWIPGTSCWKKHHWTHYALIIGYEQETESFIALDADAIKYDIYKIPCERFVMAVRNCPFEIDGYTINSDKNPIKFTLRLDSVIQNAEKIIQSIENNIKSNNTWDYTPHYIEFGQHFELFSMYAFQIMNRHIANSLLFKRLAELQMISDEICTYAVNTFKELRTGWETIKNIFIKSDMITPRTLDTTHLKNLKNSLLEQEKVVWKNLINNYKQENSKT